jgi:hypothetical protein
VLGDTPVLWLANGESDCQLLLEAATVAVNVASGLADKELISDIDTVLLVL